MSTPVHHLLAHLSQVWIAVQAGDGTPALVECPAPDGGAGALTRPLHTSRLPWDGENQPSTTVENRANRVPHLGLDDIRGCRIDRTIRWYNRKACDG